MHSSSYPSNHLYSPEVVLASFQVLCVFLEGIHTEPLQCIYSYLLQNLFYTHPYPIFTLVYLPNLFLFLLLKVSSLGLIPLQPLSSPSHTTYSHVSTKELILLGHFPNTNCFFLSHLIPLCPLSSRSTYSYLSA